MDRGSTAGHRAQQRDQHTVLGLLRAQLPVPARPSRSRRCPRSVSGAVPSAPPGPARPVPAHLGAELVEVVHVGAHGLRQRLAGEVEQPHGGGGAGAGPGGWSRRRLSLSIGGRTFRTRTAEGTRGSRPDQAAPTGGSLAPAARAGPGVGGAGV